MKILQMFFVLCIFVLHSVIAEDFEKPQGIDLFQYPESGRHEHSNLIDARIWGWSRDGKVAYSVAHSIDGRGGEIIQYCIMDMITDEILFRLSIDSVEYDLYGSSENYTMETMYDLKKEAILQSMNDYGIEALQTDFLPFPIRNGNVEYNCFADAEYRQREGFDYNSVIKYDIVVNKNGKNKIIRHNSDLYPYFFAVEVCGYFMSPFENRVLIVTYDHYLTHGYAAYIFSGCHLGVGFK